MTAMFPLPGMSARHSLQALSGRALKLSVPMYSTRIESGTSASTQISTGMPMRHRLVNLRAEISRAAPRERQIPAGCCSTILRNAFLPPALVVVLRRTYDCSPFYDRASFAGIIQIKSRLSRFPSSTSKLIFVATNT